MQETNGNNTLTIPVARLSESLVTGVQYLSRRDIFNELSSDYSEFYLTCKGSRFTKSSIEWIRVNQVGYCLDFSSHEYFSAIQKALFSCHKPYDCQLVFLIHGNGEKINMYIGLRKLSEDFSKDFTSSYAENLSSYLNTILPGTKADYIQDLDNAGGTLVKEIEKKKYHHMYALTGIPSFSSKSGEETLTSIDNLIGPLSTKKFVYYVVANPKDERFVCDTMTKCLEIAGKIESLKRINISEGSSISATLSTSETFSKTTTKGTTDSVQKIGKKHHLWCKILSTMGLTEFVDKSSHTIIDTTSTVNGNTVTSGNSKGFNASNSMTIINKCAEYASEQMANHAKRYNEGLGNGMWEVGTYLLTEDKTGIADAAQLRSIVSGKESSLEPVRVHDLSKLINSCSFSSNILSSVKSFCMPEIFINTINDEKDDIIIKNDISQECERLTTILNTSELTCYINFPRHSVPGLSVVDYAQNFNLTPQIIREKVETINLGKLLYSGSLSNIDVHLPLKTFSRHALVCGVNGSGKTNTVLNILDGFQTNNRPFLVIEPAKTEYVDWALKYNENIDDPKKKIRVFIPGCKRYVNARGEFKPDTLKMNPFEVIKVGESELRVLSHIDRLKATFSTAFPMQDILPVIMEHLLYFLYNRRNKQMGKNDSLFLNTGFPTLSDIDIDFIQELMQDIGYASENSQNISAALRTRFNSLRYGWKSELLDNPKLTGISWDELFGSPIVVNLSYAGDDQDRAFIMSMLLQFLYEYRIAEAESGRQRIGNDNCRHLVVVEEAHRVMGQAYNPDSPQYKSGLMFSNFLSEVRAYGQGMMIIDQIPIRLIEDAIKNTNIKIIHKLVAADDIQQLGESVGLTKDQQKVISKLSIGQAVLSGFNSANVMSGNNFDIYLAQINKKK